MANYHDIRYDMTLSSSTTGGGSMVLLATETASSSATVTFDSNIDSTYKEYIFKFYDCHPSAQAHFQVNFRDGGSSYDATKTTTWFQADHDEGDTTTALAYSTGKDIAQGTGAQAITGAYELKTDNDASISGYLHLYDPSNTTFVKHFIASGQWSAESNFSVNSFVAGYCNVTAAIDGVQFSMSTGNIDAGTIKMYGVL